MLAVEVPGHLTLDALQRARDAVAQRHDTLRCRFLLRDRQLMMVDDAPEAPINLSEKFGTDLDAVLEEATNQPFDMINGPFWRINAWHRSSEATVVQLVIHHTISDGWSLDILMQDFVQAFQQGSLEAGESAQGFANFLAQPTDPSAQPVAFWDNGLAELAPTTATFPTEYPVPARAAPEGHFLRRKLPADLRQSIEDKAAQHGPPSLFCSGSHLGIVCMTSRGTPTVWLRSAMRTGRARYT